MHEIQNSQNTGIQFRNVPLTSQTPRWNPLQPNNFGRFKKPLTILTTAEKLTTGKTAAPKKALSSKTEVKHNRIDKTESDIKEKYFNLLELLCSDQVIVDNYFHEKESSVKSKCSVNPQVSVKSRLKNHLD